MAALIFVVMAGLAFGASLAWGALWVWAAGLDMAIVEQQLVAPMMLSAVAGVLAWLLAVFLLIDPADAPIARIVGWAAGAVGSAALLLAVAWPPLHIYAGWSLLR